MKKNFLFKGVAVLGAISLLANTILPGLQAYAADLTADHTIVDTDFEEGIYTVNPGDHTIYVVDQSQTYEQYIEENTEVFTAGTTGEVVNNSWIIIDHTNFADVADTWLANYYENYGEERMNDLGVTGALDTASFTWGGSHPRKDKYAGYSTDADGRSAMTPWTPEAFPWFFMRHEFIEGETSARVIITYNTGSETPELLRSEYNVSPSDGDAYTLTYPNDPEKKGIHESKGTILKKETFFQLCNKNWSTEAGCPVETIEGNSDVEKLHDGTVSFNVTWILNYMTEDEWTGANLKAVKFADGETPVELTFKKVDGKITLQAPTATGTKEGYVCNGWTSDDGYTFGTPITGDITLVSECLKQHTISFDTNGGIPATMENQVKLDGEKVTKPENPTKTGYVLAGWLVSDEEYDFGKVLTGTDDNIALVAKWEAITSTGGAKIDDGSEEGTGMVVEADAEATPTVSGDAIQTKGYTATVQGEVDLDIYTDADGNGSGDVLLTGKVNFTKAISVKIPVASGDSVNIKVKHNGDDSFGIDGLATTGGNCTGGKAETAANVYDGGKINVNSGYAEIWTCSASKFVAYTETKNPDTTPSGGSSGGSSGGGGSKGGSSSSSSTTTSTTNKVTTNTDKKLDETKADDSKSDGNTPAYNDKYSKEFNDAYQFAYKNGITTMPSIEEADMEGTLTRIAMAKMLSQYAINVLGKTPDTTKVVPAFPDVTAQMDADYNNGVTLAYQLGIMGIGIDKFRPDDLVTRAEFATALSRLLFNTPDGEEFYYTTHLQKLMDEKIITNNNPDLQELRGYVMIMLMRSAQS